jgi:phosphoribosylformylglycinamidine synthase
MGERTPLALLDAAASARMAVGEGADQHRLGADRALARREALGQLDGRRRPARRGRRAVRCGARRGHGAVPGARHRIPVGKDSCRCARAGRRRAAARSRDRAAVADRLGLRAVADVRLAVTPELRALDERHPAAAGRPGRGPQPPRRLGAGAGLQRRSAISAAGLDDARAARRFFATMQALIADGLLLAYHDRSDGGLFVTLVRDGVRRPRAALASTSPRSARDALAALFSEELGAVMQVRDADLAAVRGAFAAAGLGGVRHVIGGRAEGDACASERRARDRRARAVALHGAPGRRLSPHAARCATIPTARARNTRAARRSDDPGLTRALAYDPVRRHRGAVHRAGVRPRVAVLREQGVNGQVEMAAAFDRAGFEAVDVHMSDVLAAALDLVGFSGSRPAAASPTATCSAPAGLGQDDPVQRARARRSSRPSSRARHLRARRLQRLPDDVATCAT